MSSLDTTRIAASTHVGPVGLTVADLDRSVRYYRRSIGLEVQSSEGREARLGVGGRVLVALQELPGARPVQSYTGLYHFALRVPDRPSLGRWLLHAVEDEVRIGGAADHFFSEALYLNDPDGHGIEIYRDRPRDLWEGKLDMPPNEPLDFEGLVAEAEGERGKAYAGMPPGTDMGHVHLQVRDIPEAIGFYRDVLGFDLMFDLGTAAFLGAGGYHHHIGTNTWHSRGSSPAPEGSASLRFATILVPDAGELARVTERLSSAGINHEASGDLVAVQDPSGIRLQVEVSPAQPTRGESGGLTTPAP